MRLSPPAQKGSSLKISTRSPGHGLARRPRRSIARFRPSAGSIRAYGSEGGLDAETSVRYAVIVSALRGAGTPIPTNEVWIAASAMQHGLGAFTTDPHYEKVPQSIVERLSAA
jgi:predicted nucleic acid-binding protein